MTGLRAALLISLLAALFAAAPAGAQTLTATPQFDGPLYEGDQLVQVTISGFTITGEYSEVGLELADRSELGSGDYSVESEPEVGSAKDEVTVLFTFGIIQNADPDKRLVLKLYHLGPGTNPARTDHGEFTLTIKNGRRPQQFSLNMPTSGGGKDPTRGITLRESNSAGVKVEVWLSHPPPGENGSARVDFTNSGQARWGGTSGTNSIVNKIFNKENYNKRQTVILRPGPDNNSDDWKGNVTADPALYYYLPNKTIPVTIIDTTAIPEFDTQGLTLIESGPAKSYTVKLDRDPDADVTLVTQADPRLLFKGPDDTAFGEHATVTFTTGASGSWKTPQTVEVKHIQDSDETNWSGQIVHERGSRTQDWQLQDGNVSVTLTDAGNAPIFSRVSVPVVEGGAAETYTVKLERDPGRTVVLAAEVPSAHRQSVKVQAPRGQPGARADITFTSGTWQTPQTITVTAVSDDNLVDETVTLAHGVSSSLNWPAGVKHSVEVQVSDRGGGQVELSKGTTMRVWEGQDAETYTVKLSRPPTDEVTITIASSDTTKLTVSPTTLTFNASNFDQAQTVSLASPAGSVGEGESVTVTHAVTGYGATTDGPEITAFLVDTTLTETLKLQFTEMRFSGEELTYDAPNAASVNVSLQGPGGYKGFLPAVSFRVCFQDGEATEFARDIAPLTPGEKCVDGSLDRETQRPSQETRVDVFNVRHDSLDEKFEKLTVTLQAHPDNPLPAMVTIPEAGKTADFIVEDAQLTKVKFTRTDTGSIQEGGSDKATFEFATQGRSLYAGEEIRVPLKIGGDGITGDDYAVSVVSGGTLSTDAPYSASAPALVIKGSGKTINDVGGNSQKIVFEVAALADGVAEGGSQTMTVGHTAPVSNLNTDGVRFETGATELASDSQNDVEVEIIEHPTVSIAADGDVTEGNDAVFSLTVAPAPGTGESISVGYDLAQTGDFVAAADVGTGKTVSVDDTGTASITVATVDDSVDETDGSLAATLVAGTGYVIAAAPDNAATVNISDDEDTLVTLSADTNVTEGGKATVTATINGLAQAGDVTIPINVITGDSGGTAETTDYDDPASITITAGEKTGTTELVTHLDADKDADTVKLALGTLPDGLAAGDPASVTVSIDDDGKGVEATLTSSATSVANGDPVTITVSLDRAFAAKTPIPITVAGSGANPAEATEWEAPASIEVAAGATSATASIDTIRDQDTASEEFTVSFGSPLPDNLSTGTPNSAKVTITDDGLGHSITFSASPNPVDEDNTTTLTATANGIFDAEVTVPLALTNGTAETGDYATPTTGITIAKGAMSGTGTLTTIGDADTDDDTFNVRVGTPLPSWVRASSTGYTITIKDTKAFAVVKPKLTLTTSPAKSDDYPFAVSVDEGESVTVTATLDRAHSADIVLPVTMTPGRDNDNDEYSAESGDYGSLANITIKTGQTTGTGTVTTNQDDDEDDEYFYTEVDLSGLGDAVEYDESYYGGLYGFTVEIVDDDKPLPTVQFWNFNRLPESEGEGFFVSVEAGIPFVLYEGGPTFINYVDYDIVVYIDVTQEGRFLKSESLGRKKLTVRADSGRANLELHLDDDAIDEPNGRVTLTLVEDASYTFDPSNKTLTGPIADNDPTLVTMTAPIGDIAEAGGSKTVTITLGRALVDKEVIPVNLKFGSAPGYATMGTDFTLSHPTSPPSGVSYKNFDSTDASVNPPAIVFTGGKNAAKRTTFTLTAKQDTVVEQPGLAPVRKPFESVQVKILNFHGNKGFARNDGATGGFPEPSVEFRILDDDEVTATAGLVLSHNHGLRISEGKSETFTVKLATQPSSPVTVAISYESLFTDVSDALSVSPTSLSFTTSDWNQPQSVKVTALPDEDAENERTYINITPTDYTDASEKSMELLTEDAGAGLTLTSPSPSSITVNNTSTYTVKLKSKPSNDVTVTPVSSNESVATASGDLTFTSANWNQAQTVTVTGQGAGTVQIAHTWESSDNDYGNQTMATSPVDFSVTDSGSRTLTLEALTTTVEEGKSITVTAKLDRAHTVDTKGNLIFTLGGNRTGGGQGPETTAEKADFTPNTRTTVTIPAGSTSVPITLSTVNEAEGSAVYEGAETFGVALFSGGTRGVSADFNNNSAIITITDEADQPVFELVPPDPLNGAEGDQSKDRVFKVTKTGATERPATVEIASADGTATSPGDYTPADETLNFAAGDTEKSVTVSFKDDEVDELKEDFTVTISNPTDARLGATTSATVELTDDDPTVVQLTVGALAIDEAAGTKDIMVTLARALTTGEILPVTLDFAGDATFGEDYTLAAKSKPTGVTFSNLGSTDPATNKPTITFTGGDSASNTASITLTATGDKADEGDDESVTVSLGVLGGSSGTGLDGGAEADSAKYTGSFKITDDDGTPTSISLSVDTDTATDGAQDKVSEGIASPPSVEVTASIDGGSVFTDDKTLRVEVVGDTATVGDDFAAVTGFDLEIPAGDSSVKGSFTLTPVYDGVKEADETISVTGTLTPAVQGLTVNPATITLTDDSVIPEISVAVDNSGKNITEGSDAVWTLTSSVSIPVDLTVNVALTQEGSFVAAQTLTDTATVTIPKNTTSATLTIATEADSTDEADGSLSLALAAADNGEYTVSTAQGDADVAVSDDDATSIALVAGASTTLTEGDTSTSATLTLRLGRALVAGEIVEVPLAITSSTGAVIDELTDGNRDYLLSVSGTGVTGALVRRPNPKVKFTGAAGVREATITLTATARDDDDEDHETLSITLGNIQANNLATSISGGVVKHDADNDPQTTENTVAITIQDDEGLKPELNVFWASSETLNNSPTEGGTVKMLIKADPAPQADMTVHFTVSERAGANYVAADEEGAKTVTLRKGATEIAVNVPTVNDENDEIGGLVYVTLVANDAYRLGGRESYSRLVKDDDATPVTIERDCGFKTCYPISENGATAEFAISLGLALNQSSPPQTVTVPLNVSGATAGTHYTLGLKSGAQTGVTWLDSGSYSAQNPAVRFSGAGAKKAVLTLTTIDNNDNNARTLDVSLGTLTANQLVYGGVEKGEDSTASVKIVNDDGTPVVRVEAQVAEMYEGQDVGGSRRPNPRMYIYADPVPQTDITVSATLSQIGDVIDASGTPPGKLSYTFKAGQAAPQVVEFRIDNDLDDEPTSFVTLEVHAGQGYTLSPTKSSATTRVTDKDGGPTVSLTAASASVTEGGNATFTLTRGTEGAEPRWEDTGISRVRLRISQRGDFVADADLGEKTITLTKGKTSATYDVPTIGDGKGEKDGTITVELLPNRTNVNQLSGYAVDFPPNNQAVITVVDDDGGAPGVLFYNLNTTVSEKNLSKTGSYTVELATDPVQTATLTVNVPTAHQDSLTVQAPGGTAGASATLDFTPGAGGTWDTPQMITVAPLIDEDGEPDTFDLTHSIANYTGHTGPIEDVEVTVEDLGYNLRLSHNNGNKKLEVAEPAGQESYSLWLTSRPANSVTVTPTSSDAALASVGAAVTFTSSDWKDPKPIAVSGLKQGTLTITHAVSSTDSNYQLSGNFPVGVTVIADTRRTVELSAAPEPVVEGAEVTLTATIPQAVYPQKAVTIPLSYTEGTAVAADYTETASITIDAGQTTGTATLATVDDTDYETPDETFTVAFGTLPRELLAGATTSVDISIDDAADVVRKVDLSVAKNPVREGDDSVELTVTLDAALTAPARAVTIPLSYTLGTAEAEDFTEVADVTIAAEEASATVTIPIVDDTTYETPHETFTVGLGALPAGLEAGETVEIEVEIDDTSDAPAVVTFEASKVRAPDTGHVVTVQLDKPLPQDLTIPLVYTFGTAKASDINQVANITIAAGNSGPVTGGTITFNLVNNSIFDGGTFTLSLGALPLPAAQLVSGDIDEMEITILDEADSPGFAYVSPETGGVTHLVEGSPELALIRTGNATASSFIAYRTSRYSGGAATPGSDYELTPVGESALIEVPGGGAMPTLTLPIIDDDEDEFFSEYFYFEVQRNGHIGAKSVPNGRRTIRIVDDDPTPVSLSPSSDVSIDEGDDNTTARLTLKLARPLNTSYFPDGRLEEVAEIPLVITTSSGAALPGSADPDFTIAVSGGAVTATGLNSATPKIKFENPSGNVQNANTATITITATTRDDGDFQDEAIQIALGDLTASTLATNLEGGVSASDDGDPSTTDNVIDLKIVDDEEGPDGFDLSVDTGSVAENAQAAATINVTATAKGGGSFTEDHDIEITVGGAEDTAISGTDYAAVEKFTFTVTAGQSSGSGSFSLDPTDDTLDEADETLSVTGASGSLEITPASITITDDDAEPTVSVADATAVAEGDDPAVTVDMTFTVSLSAASGKEVTVPYTLTGTATDGADYDAPATQSLSIAAGDTSGEIVIPVKGDAIDEVDETIIVTLSAPTNATISSEAGAGTATGSITDDDVPELSISGGAAVTEGTAASFTVDADIAPVADLTVKVDVDTTAGFAASNTTGAQTFTFRAGEMSETYEVNTESDSIDEADGSVSVTLKDGTDYTVATTGDTASVDVNDDDATSVTLGRTGSGGIAEDGGAVDVTVTLGRALVAGESVTVPLTVSGATVATHYTLALKDGGGTGVSLDTAAPHGAQNPAVTLAGAEAQTATLTLTAVANTDRVARTVAIAYGASARAPSSSGLSGGIATSGAASVAILDDDAKISVGDASAAEGSAVAFTVTLPDPAPSGGVTIAYSTSNGRGESTDATHQVATSADDYTAAAANASITIAQGDSSGAISIATTDDDTYEGDHYFTLTLDSTNTFNISDTAGSATGTITDAADTPSFAFSAASTAAEEADGTVTLTVAKTGKTLVAATVSYATTDGTATGGSDFTAIASTNLSFAVADTSKDITVSLTNDSNDEPTEAFTVDLTAGADAQLGSTKSHTVNITDNDATTVTLEAPSTAIDENAGAKTITVTLGRALTGDETLAVPLTFAGTSVFGTDYTLAEPNSTPTGVSYSNLASTDLAANPPTISFSGVTSAADSATVILTATADTTDEGATESVTVGLGTLNANSGANLGGGASGSGTATFNITDDDDAPGGITLTVDKSTIAEDAATATVKVTATVTGGTAYSSAKTVSVKVGESSDSAVEGTDYANVADYDLTINAMETSAEWTFSLDPTDDTLDEDTETLRVTGASGDISVTGASITITDDDDAPTVSVADATAVSEGNDPNATVNLSFAVTLDAASGKQVTVPYTLAGTATATDDYTEPNPLSVTIAAGSRSASIDVPVKGDTLDEPNETVTVTLGAPTNATVSTTEGAGEASGTITDDDATPTATLTLTPAAIGESGATNESTVTASLNGATSQDLTLTVAAAPVPPALAGDFTLSSIKTLTIAAGATASTGAVTVTAVDNSVDAPDKTVTVSAAASGGNGVASPADVTLTINDDEGTPTVSVADATAVAEGNDPMTTQDMSFALTLSGTSSQTVTVPYTLTGSATGGSDYETPNPLSATIAAGQSSGTILVKVKGDTADEVDETIDVTLGTPTNATVSTVQGAGTASGTITDDDATTVELARASSGGIAEASGKEDLTITLGRALAAGESVTVPLAVSGATVTTHYTLALKGTGGTGVSLDTTTPHSAGSPAVTLAGAGAQTATLTLTAVANTDNASRTVAIAYGTSTRAPSSTGLSGGISTSGSASVPILDDDAMVSVAAASAAEGSAVVFTVTLPEDAPSGGVTIAYSTSDGRGNNDDATHQVATSADYTAAAENATLSIAQGQRTGTVSISTTQDSTYEGDHYFTLNLDSTSHFNLSKTAGAAVGTITDAADTPSFAFSAASTNADEDDGSLTLTVARTGDTLVAATVSYATTDGTATGGSDFTAIASTDLDFTASEASKTINVSLTDDSTDEPAEAFTVDLTAGAHAKLGSTNSHSISITDNDATTVTLEAPSTAIDEDAGTRTITVELGRELSGDEALTVPLTFAGAATFGTDYTLAAPNSTPTGVSYSNLASTDLSTSPPSIAFSGVENAASSATVILMASDDSTDEGAAESVTVGLGTLNANSGTNLDGGASGSGTATFNITDDDDAPTGITLSVDTTTIAEDDDPATVTVTATVNGGTAYQSDTTVRVKVGESGDTAVEGTDYANVADFDLLIEAGAMSVKKTFSLNPTDNALDEADKTISVTGTSNNITVTGATIALTDDDVPELSVSGPAVTEGSDAVFTIAAAPAPHTDLSVQFAVSESGGFVAAADTGSGKSVTLAKGASSVTFDVETIGDTVDEASGAVTLTLADGTGYALGSTKSANIGILDDDKTQVSLSAGAAGAAVADTTLTEREPTDTGSLTITLSRDLAPGEIAEVPLALTTATGMVIAETDAARRDFTLSASGTGVSLADENTAAPKVTITGGAATEQVATLTFAATSRDDGDLDLDRLRVALGGLTQSSLGTVLDGGIEAGAGLNRDFIDIIDYRDPAVVLSTASIDLKERFTGVTYDVQLASNPRATVTVKLSAGEQGKLTLEPSTLTFTPDGDTAWNSAQKVTITAVTDGDVDDETITVSHEVTRPQGHALSPGSGCGTASEHHRFWPCAFPLRHLLLGARTRGNRPDRRISHQSADRGCDPHGDDAGRGIHRNPSRPLGLFRRGLALGTLGGGGYQGHQAA